MITTVYLEQYKWGYPIPLFEFIYKAYICLFESIGPFGENVIDILLFCWVC